MRYLWVFFLVPSFVFSFDAKVFDDWNWNVVKDNEFSPLKLKDNKILFKTKLSTGTYDKSEIAKENRYFLYSPAQRSNGSVVSYRFDPSVSRKDLKDSEVPIQQMSYFQNEWRSFSFKNYTFSPNSEALYSAQYCWQTTSVDDPKVKIEGVPIQCVIANKQICDQVNKGGYDWDKDYRKAAQAFRQQMVDTVNREVMPKDLNERYSLGFLDYKVLSDYNNQPKDLSFSIASDAKLFVQKACRDYPWSDKSAAELPVTH